MKLLIQISDPHFGTEVPPVVEALVRLVHAQTPELVVLSGDITQRAKKKQFRAARRFIDRLAVPATLAIPGNHDIPLFNPGARLFKPYAKYKREFGPDLEPVFESDWLLALALNTTRRLRHTDGVVSKVQIDRVALRLQRARPGQLRIVVIHQPVCVTLPEDDENLLHGRAEAVRRWSAAGADLILGGHIHLPYVRPLTASFADLARPVWAVQAGTAVSRRIRREAGNSVNLIRYAAARGDRRCTVERWDFQPMSQHFVHVGSDELHLGAPLDAD